MYMFVEREREREREEGESMWGYYLSQRKSYLVMA